MAQLAVVGGSWAVGAGSWAVGVDRWAVEGARRAVGAGSWAVGAASWAVGADSWAAGLAGLAGSMGPGGLILEGLQKAPENLAQETFLDAFRLKRGGVLYRGSPNIGEVQVKTMGFRVLLVLREASWRWYPQRGGWLLPPNVHSLGLAC